MTDTGHKELTDFKKLPVFDLGGTKVTRTSAWTPPKGAEPKSISAVSTITVDATKKPAHFDRKEDEGLNKDKTAFGIIAIDGDTIKICSGRPGVTTRPIEFKTSKDEPYSLLTLKKVKE